MCKLEFRGDGDAPLAGKCLVVDPGLTPDQLLALELAAAAIGAGNRDGGALETRDTSAMVKQADHFVDVAMHHAARREFEAARDQVSYALACLLRLSACLAAADRLHQQAAAVCPDLWPVAATTKEAAS